MVEGDVENLRALARARSCRLFYSCLQQPPSHRHHTHGWQDCYSKSARRILGARDVGCRDNLAEESALSTTSKTIDSRTDHMIVSESVYYSRSFVDPEDALETVMMMFRFLSKGISILLRLCCTWGYPSRKHATRKTQP
jgi:hypothetical protein